MKRWLTVLLAATALTLVGCNKQESSTTEVTEAEAPAGEATEAETAEATPAGTPAEAAAPPVADAAVPSNDPTAAPTPAAPAGGEVTLPGGTKYTDVQVGTGAEVTPGSTVVVHYTGTLLDGTKFDSSLDRNKPFEFVIDGTAMPVIEGWNKGVVGMKVGGVRKLTVPPDQAYGAEGKGPIPPNSTLLFDIELLGVK